VDKTLIPKSTALSTSSLVGCVTAGTGAEDDGSRGEIDLTDAGGAAGKDGPGEDGGKETREGGGDNDEDGTAAS